MTTCRALLTIAALMLVAACATIPPKPAMAPLGVNGPFGYSEQPIVQDRTAVSYTGPFIDISPSDPRNDARLQGELSKTYDLALWRAAQIGQQQGYAALKVEHEQRDSDVEVRDIPVANPFPNYAYCRGRCFGRPLWYYNDYYDVQRYAQGRAVIHLTVSYNRQFSPTDVGALSIAELLSQMQLKWSTAMY